MQSVQADIPVKDLDHTVEIWWAEDRVNDAGIYDPGAFMYRVRSARGKGNVDTGGTSSLIPRVEVLMAETWMYVDWASEDGKALTRYLRALSSADLPHPVRQLVA